MRVRFFCVSRIRHWVNILPNWSFTWSIKHLYIFDLLSSWNCFFFNLEPRVISAHFQLCRNDPGLEITNLCLFVTKKVPVPFATVMQFSPQQINCQSLYGPITDSYLFWGTSLANFALNLKKKKKKKRKKKNKNRDSSNRHCFLSLPTRGQQISQIKMGLLRRRLIFAKDFDMNKFLTSQYIRRHKMYLYMTEKILFVYRLVIFWWCAT